MQNLTFKISAILTFAILLGSCARDNSVVSNHRIQKRKHTGGFHIELNKKYKVQKDEAKIEEEDVAVTEKKVDVKTPSETFSFNNISAKNVEDKKAEEKQTFKSANALPSKNEKLELSHKISPKKSEVESLSFAQVKKDQNTQLMVKELRQELKKDQKNAPLPIESIVYILLCIFIPFVAVGLATDWEVKDVVINLLLCLLCGIPGIIHAFIVCKREGVI